MKGDHSKAIYFGLGYSALISLVFLWTRLGFSLDITTYPYQKPLMLMVAAIAAIVCVMLLVFDIRRKNAGGIGMRVIIVLAVIMLTFDSFMSIWGFLMLYIGGGFA